MLLVSGLMSVYPKDAAYGFRNASTTAHQRPWVLRLSRRRLVHLPDTQVPRSRMSAVRFARHMLEPISMPIVVSSASTPNACVSRPFADA